MTIIAAYITDEVSKKFKNYRFNKHGAIQGCERKKARRFEKEKLQAEYEALPKTIPIPVNLVKEEVFEPIHLSFPATSKTPFCVIIIK